MKILIDINHPAHVHYFRNFIKMMESKGHSFVVTNRDDKLINYLLDYYQIVHIIRNKRSNKRKSIFTSFCYFFSIVYYVLLQSIKNKPDAFLGVSAPCSIVAFLLRKPSIVLDDTEHNKINHLLFKPFASLILTPYYYKKQLRSDQVYFRAFLEQLYIDNISVKTESVLANDYVFCRFSSFDASHDAKVGIELLEEKRKEIVKELARDYKVVISCEDSALQSEYSEYYTSFKPEEIHEVLRNAILVISDGATIASEAGLLKTPYVYTNPLDVGYIDEQILIYPWAQKMDYQEVLLKLKSGILLQEKQKLNTIVSEDNSFINPTDLLLWIFRDLKNNIIKIQGQTIDRKFFNSLKSNTYSL